jgi:catechol 2,3-dioxygenase-like lactoylglutathione lyase family enzyme
MTATEHNRELVEGEGGRPAWHGVNHLALVTPDMDTTVRFYAGVLGMPLVATLMAGPMRHYFFEIAPGNTVAFFEVAGMETFAKPAGARSDRTIQLDHISFDVPDEAALMALHDRLAAHGCEVTTEVDHGLLRSIYFHDPNGIALEASYWVEDPTGGNAALSDPNPVAAVGELQSGHLEWMPTTQLA